MNNVHHFEQLTEKKLGSWRRHMR